MMDNRPPIDELLNCTAEELAARPKATLIWENANPTSKFPPQKVTLDLSGYDMVEIEFQWEIDSEATFYGKTKVGRPGVVSMIRGTLKANPYTGQIGAQIRGYNTSSTGIDFLNGVYMSDGNEHNATEEGCIPLRIYGIKGVQ